METIALEPEVYAPVVNEHGDYVDKVPSIILHGIRCPCSNRKDKVYATKQTFSSHIRTKLHVKWIEELNHNRANFFVENVKLNEVCKHQQQIIAKLEIEVKNKCLTIDYLTQALTRQTPGPGILPPPPIQYDLLDINS